MYLNAVFYSIDFIHCPGDYNFIQLQWRRTLVHYFFMAT